MRRRHLPAALAATTAVAGGAVAAPVAQRVVYHVGDEGGPDHAQWRVALSNRRNHLDALGGANLDLVCVLNATGIRLLLAAEDPGPGRQVAALRARGARFLVCGNSMRGQKLAREALFQVSETDIVPAGVVELVRLQQQGFGYIRP
jgi:uncharacterized protein